MKSFRVFMSEDSGGATAVADAVAESAESIPQAGSGPEETPIGSRETVGDAERIQKALAIEAEIAADDRELAELEEELEGVKGRIKAKTAEREQKVNELRAAIKGEYGNLFDGVDGSASTSHSASDGEEQAGETSDEYTGETITSENYESVKLLDVVGMAKKKLRKNAIAALETIGLITIGDYKKFCASGKGLDDIKGLGKGGLQILDDSLQKFWELNPNLADTKSQPAAKAEKPSPTAAAAAAGLPGFAPYADFGFNANDLQSAMESGESLSLQETDGRFASGDYIVIGRAGENFTLLPALTKAQWDELVGKHEREHRADPPGDRAGKTVKVGSEERYLGSTDTAITLVGEVATTAATVTSSEKVVKPYTEFGVEPGSFAKIATASLLSKTADGVIPVLMATMEDNGVQYVVTPAGPPYADNVYALRPLLTCQDDREPDSEDPYYARRVNYDGKTYDVGRFADSILVADQE